MLLPLNSHQHAHQEIVNLLLPHVETENARSALIIACAFPRSLDSQINRSGTPWEFANHIIDRLWNYGEVSPGQPALWGLLLVLKPQVGIEQQTRIDQMRPWIVQATSRTSDTELEVDSEVQASHLWDDGLNAEQRSAASHHDGSARVLAGPGTGKTRTIVQRVAYLVTQQAVNPRNILVITFTRAAARELEGRLKLYLTPVGAGRVRVRTLHSFALFVLLKFKEHSGLISKFRIADDFEEAHVIRPELARMIGRGVDETKAALRALEAAWSTQNPNHPDWSQIEFRVDLGRALDQLETAYNFKLRGQLITDLVTFLKNNPILASQLDVEHLLVDEFQDLNECDQQVLTLMEEAGASLFVVGDDDQSIYDFRHAYPSGLREFITSHRATGDYKLLECRRCPSNIIELAIRLMAHEPRRIAKRLVSNSVNTGIIRALQFGSYQQEASGIARICEAYIGAGVVKPKDISILLPAKKLAPPLFEALREKNQLITALNYVTPFDTLSDDIHAEGRQLLCLLRLVLDFQTEDALALRTWMGLQTGIGEHALDDLRQVCLSRNTALIKILDEVSLNPRSISRHGNRLKENFDRLQEWIKELQTFEELSKLLSRAIDLQVRSPLIRERIHIFLTGVIEKAKIGSLRDLLEVIQSMDYRAEDLLLDNAIRIMTIHKAKGLSAKLVIIPGMESDLMPGGYAEDVARRLMYVAATRSSCILMFTHALYRGGSQRYSGSGTGNVARQASAFLNEMGVRSQDGNRFVQELSAQLASQPHSCI